MLNNKTQNKRVPVDWRKFLLLYKESSLFLSVSDQQRHQVRWSIPACIKTASMRHLIIKLLLIYL